MEKSSEELLEYQEDQPTDGKLLVKTPETSDGKPTHPAVDAPFKQSFLVLCGLFDPVVYEMSAVVSRCFFIYQLAHLQLCMIVFTGYDML